MKKILGAFLFAIAFLGAIFFRNYHGTVIPYPTLWYVLFIAIGFLGVWLVVTSVRKNILSAQQEYDAAIETMKLSAKEIEVDFEKCVFNTGSYSQEVQEGMQPVDLLIPGPLAFHREKETEFVVSSYIIYTDDENDSSSRYISQAFSLDIVSLKVQVLNKKMFLYVDRHDKRKYFFELKE
ncbi:MAG: hypothetical protein EOO01_03245 [Chitinophagaceae bacterium]|nr:MAG: hypothetical protein EOO01_03245 [Chitinophagaceae bacterium]